MYNFAPEDYICPLCLTLSGVESDQTMARQADIIYRDDLVMAMVNSKFITDHEGHVIIVPVTHFENIFDIPDKYLRQISLVSKHLAKTLKEVYKCDGVMLQQNNGPASGQHAFHYHLHIIPRYKDISFFDKSSYVADPQKRVPFAGKIKKYLKDNPFRPE